MSDLMRHLFLVLALLLALVGASAQAQTKLREVDLRINGVGSGSSYQVVLAKLGKPTKRNYQKESAESSCLASDATILILQYPGIKVVLLGDGSGRNLKVVEMRMTGGKWSPSGIALGATAAQVTRRFGEPVSTEREGARSTFFYVTPGNLGGVRFEFTKGRLTLIGMSEALC